MSPTRSLQIALAVALAVAASACSTDEPAEAPPAGGGPTTAPAPSAAPAQAPPAARDAPRAEATAPGATPTPTSTPTAPPVTAVTTPGDERPLQPVSLPAFDPLVTAVVGTPSLAGLVAAFARSGTELGAAGKIPPRPLEAALEVVRMRLNLVDVAWLDSDKPVRLAVPEPKAYPEGFFLLLPVRGGEAAVKQGLGAGLAPAPGHLGRLTADGRALFVDLLGDHLALTSHDDLYAKLTAYAKDVLLAWTPPDLLDVEVSVSGLRAAFAEELQSVRGMVGALGEQLTQRAAIPVQAATLRALVDGAFGFVEGTDRVGVAVAPSGERLRLAFGLRGVAGGSLAETVGALAGRRIETLGVASAGTWLGIGSSLPSVLTRVDKADLAALLSSGGDASFSPAQAERLAGHAAALSEASTGDSTFVVGTEGQFPFAVSLLSLVTDRKQAREAMLGILDVVLQVQLAAARERLSAGGADARVKLETLADVVTFANTLGAPLGARLEVVDEARGDVQVKALVAHIDWERMGLAKSEPGFFGVVQALIGPRLAAALADGEGRLALTLGPGAVDQAVALAAGKLPGGEPNLTRAGVGAVGALSLRVGAMLQALAGLPSMQGYAADYAKIPADQAITLQAAVREGTLVITADVALPLLLVLMR